MERRRTKQIFVGSVPIGGGAPIAVQSMTNTNTQDWQATVKQIRSLEEAGCEIIRVAVEKKGDLEALPRIKKEIRIPLIADTHEDFDLVMGSLLAGADCLRINPGKIGGEERLIKIAKVALERQIPIRIGVNSGSIKEELLRIYGHPTPQAIVESALTYIQILEDQKFDLIKVSLKSSNVLDTIAAYRLFAEQSDYPLHVGVTEAGLPIDAAVKSAIGIGFLLYEGIGDTLRVSVTGDPVIEMQVAYGILRALDIRQRGINLISCPTCGRTRIDMAKLAKDVALALRDFKTPLNVAITGCSVNGPGEAKEADVGISWEGGKGSLFKKGVVIEKELVESELLPKLLREVERMSGEKASGQNMWRDEGTN